MSRLAQCGFELNSANAGVEFSANAGGIVQSTTKHAGSYAYQVSSLSSGAAKGGRLQFLNSAGNGPYYCGIYLRIATAPSGDNTILELNDAGAFTTPIVYLKLTSSRTLLLFDEDGQIGSASSAIPLDEWHYIDILIDRTPAAGSQVVRARLDGSEFAGAAAQSLSAGVHTLCWGGNLLLEAQTTGSWFFDDIRINDGAGSFCNSYPGEGNIVHLRPDGAGAASAWTGDYTDLDDVTPDDGTTIISSGTLNAVEDVAITTPADIGSGDTIVCVAVGYRGSVSSGAGADPAAVCRITQGGNTEESSPVNHTSTVFLTNMDGTKPSNYRLILYDLPGASTTAWSKSAIDAAEIGMRVSTGDSDVAHVTALWLSVEYKPAAGGEVLNFSGAALAASATPNDPTLAVLRENTATLLASSATPNDPVLSVLRPLQGAVLAQSATPDADLTILRAMQTVLAAQSATPSINLLVLRAMAATVGVVSASGDGAALDILRTMQAVILAASQTPDDVSLDIPGLVVLAASILAQSGTPDTPILAVMRRLAGAAVSSSGTSTPALVLFLAFAAQISASSNTGFPDLAVLRRMAAAAGAQSGSADLISLDVLRQLTASLQSQSQTPDDVTLALALVAGLVSISFSARKPGAEYAVKQPGTTFAGRKPGVTFEE